MTKAEFAAKLRAALEAKGWRCKGMLFEKEGSKDAEALIAGFDRTIEYRTNDPDARLPKELEDAILAMSGKPKLPGLH